MKETEKYIIKACQREHYTAEINMMEKKELIKNKQLSTLDLFLDAEKILCIGGRLKKQYFRIQREASCLITQRKLHNVSPVKTFPRKVRASR